MDKQLFEELRIRYAPFITSIINDNVKYFRFRETIKWQFGFDERVAIVACCDRKTNILTINIGAVDFALRINEPLQIEYFLLHEIRHIYQHKEIADYKNNISACNNPELAKKWADEEEKYIAAVNRDGKENAEYYKQDLEFDAFAFAYAVMKYKYGEVPDISIPKAYGKEFLQVVEDLRKTFETENL